MPKFQKEFPKNAAHYFNPASDKEFKQKHPVRYNFLEFCGIIALILPMVICLIITGVLFPVPDSGFVILSIIGCLIMGIGLFNIVSAWLNQYLGHAVTFGCLFVGGAMTAAYLIIMYCPDIYALFNEALVSYYLLSLFFLWIQPLFYGLFRYSVDAWLEDRGIRRRNIRKEKKGWRNFWWYESIHQKYGLGLLYPMNKIWTCAYLSYTVLTILLGWVRMLIPVLCGLYAICSVLCSFMTLFEQIQSNKEKYGVPIVLFRKEKGKRSDSILQDAIGVLIPILFACIHISLMMDVFPAI